MSVRIARRWTRGAEGGGAQQAEDGGAQLLIGGTGLHQHGGDPASQLRFGLAHGEEHHRGGGEQRLQGQQPSVGQDVLGDDQREGLRNISSQNQLVVVTVNNPEGPFGLVTDGLSSGIPAQGSASFTVTFKPGDAGEIQDEVLLRLQDATEPEVRLPVKGAGRTLVGRGAREGCSSSGGGLGGTGLFAMLALVGLHALRRRRV